MRPWSFSSLQTYEACPHRWKLQYIDKQPQRSHPNAERGTQIHTGLENYLKGTAPLPDEAAVLAPTYAELSSRPLTIEEEWGITKDWTPTGWNAPDVWCRMKLDVFYREGDTGIIGDHKSGKDYPIKRMQQGQLYALGAKALFPELTTFVARFWYVDQGFEKKVIVTDAALPSIRASFERRVEKLQTDEQFLPISNKINCKFCPFETCQYRSEE